MLLLAVDTSGKQGSIALARGEPDGSCEVIEVVALEGGTFSAQLIPQVADLLSKHGFQKRDLDGFAVALGPGSFTGLRVGLAAVKALGTRQESRSQRCRCSKLLRLPLKEECWRRWMRARGEVYLGEYEVGADRTKMVGEKLVARADLIEIAAGATVVAGGKSLAEALKSEGIAVHEIETPRSDAIARLGWRKILAGDTVSPEALEANYIRRTDAEIFAKSNS